MNMCIVSECVVATSVILCAWVFVVEASRDTGGK